MATYKDPVPPRPADDATAYRSAIPVYPVPVGEMSLHRGRLRRCPACDQGWADIFHTACNWWIRWWHKCEERRPHMHQKCSECGCKWIVGWYVDPGAVNGESE